MQSELNTKLVVTLNILPQVFSEPFPGDRGCVCQGLGVHVFSLSGSEDRVENEKPKEKNSEAAPAAWFRLARGGLPNLTARQPVEISTRGLNHLWPCHHSFFTARAQLLLQLFLRSCAPTSFERPIRAPSTFCVFRLHLSS